MPPYDASWPELAYPSYRDDGLTVDKWIEGKRQDDGAEGLWRIHNGLYDLSDYLKNHPGGSMWLQITKGTDVTEAFESHHITNKAQILLPKFYMRPAKTARNSPYTFRSNGFYKSLKAKVNRHFENKMPELTFASRLALDIVVFSALSSAALASKFSSYYLATLTGFLLCMIVNCGHNFVHKKDSWRIYYLYLTSFSVRDFRISHCISHHLYTNTVQDLEISLFEPLLQFLPRSDKTFAVRYLSWIYFPYALSTISFGMIYKRIVTGAFTRNDFIIFIVPALMLLEGSQSVVQTFLMWAWMVMLVGFFFGVIGFTAAHHHPNIFHEGDIPRKDRDWGLQQIDAVKDRVEIHSNVYVGMFVFGEHTLHHLFPTLDYSLLPQLYPVFKETLDEFGIKWKMTTAFDLLMDIESYKFQLATLVVRLCSRSKIRYVVALIIIYISWSPHSHREKNKKRSSLYSGHNRRYCCSLILLLWHMVEFGDYVTSRNLRWYYLLTPISAICANVIAQVFYRRLEYSGCNCNYATVLIIFWLASGLVKALQFLSLINLNITFDYLRFWTAIATSSLYYILAINDFVAVLRENRKRRNDDYKLNEEDDSTDAIYRYHESCWYSKITFYWILPVLWRSYTTAPLESEFYGKLPKHEACVCQYKSLVKIYDKLKENGKPVSLWRCYFYGYWKLFVFGGFLKMVGDILSLMPPLGISVIVKYVEHLQDNRTAINVSDTDIRTRYNTPQDFYSNGFVMALIILIASIAQGSLSQGSTHVINVQGIRLKNALQAMIYSKLLRIRRTVLDKEQGGANIVTKMVSDDVNNIMSCFWIGHYVWAIPLKIMVIIFLLHREMGVSAVFGSVCCIVIMVFLQYVIGKKMSRNSKTISDWNDKRMQKMNEVLQGIKLLKLCCWENIFADRVFALRKNELKHLNLDSVYWAILTFLTNASSIVVAVLTLAFHSWIHNSSSLEASTMFTSLALFNQLTVPLFIFPIMVPLIISALVSTKRLEHFMNLPEYRKIIGVKKHFRFDHCTDGLPTNDHTVASKIDIDHHLFSVSQSFRLRKITEKSENEEDKESTRDKDSNNGICLKSIASSQEILRANKAVCSWHDDPLKSSLSIEQLVLTRGTLNVVIGDVASGKSALIKALIGEMVLFSGRINWARNTSISYVSQNTWLLNTTVKENVLFGKPYREKQFKRVLSSCALQQDVDNMTDKEQTVVGEKGVTLSGGQKQRIAIARALYSNADVVFMDDPLSSVDSKVADFIFENAIRIYVSQRKKTIVFSTNSKKLLLYANQIIFMKDCQVKASGNLSEVCQAASDEVCKWGMLSSFSNSSVRANSFEGFENAKLMRLKSRSYRHIDNKNAYHRQFWSPENSVPFIFTPLKRRLSTFSGSRYFAHDLPLPTDDCDVEVFNRDVIELHKRKRFRAATVTEGSNAVTHKTVFRASSLQINRNHSYPAAGMSATCSNDVTNARKDNTDLKNMKRHHSAASAYSEHEESNIKLLGDEIGENDVWICKNSSTTKEMYATNYKAYFTYIKACNVVFVLMFFLITFTWQVLRVISDLWLSMITSNANAPEITRQYVLYYGLLSLAVILLSLISTSLGQYIAAKARKILHERMLHNTLRCSVSFFENVLLGKIINVFSTDVDVIDKKLATSVQRLVQFQLLCLSSVFVNLIITPWFVVFVIPIILLYYLIQKFYRKSSKYLYQLENSLKWPVLSQISETVTGLETIRVFCQEERFMEMLFRKLDLHTNVFLTLNSMHRWLGITLDYLGGLIVFVAILVALISVTLYPKITTPALIGLAINYTLLVPIYLNWVVKFLADLEAYMTAVERIRTCIRMPSENYNLRADIPRNWPNKGMIEFENVTLHYNLDTKPVIQNLNIEIPAGQKVGICGRTGSGKSSLVLSLFKMVSKTEGTVKFDNVDIENVPLHVLRSCISIIPQDTIMFSGTVRDNMDFKCEYSDNEIWYSLKQVHIADTIAQLGGLEATVQEGGLNLSVGQRQMISLARAILYESTCLILDEATSSLQLEFEKEFLHLARIAFSKKTIIVITHRISSLLDFDRILVLNNGTLIEDGSPTELISNPAGTFSSMLKLMDEY